VDALRYRVLADGFAEQVGTLDISDPDELPFIDATLRGAARITGKITAAADGGAIAEARVPDLPARLIRTVSMFSIRCILGRPWSP